MSQDVSGTERGFLKQMSLSRLVSGGHSGLWEGGCGRQWPLLVSRQHPVSSFKLIGGSKAESRRHGGWGPGPQLARSHSRSAVRAALTV